MVPESIHLEIKVCSKILNSTRVQSGWLRLRPKNSRCRQTAQPNKPLSGCCDGFLFEGVLDVPFTPSMVKKFYAFCMTLGFASCITNMERRDLCESTKILPLEQLIERLAMLQIQHALVDATTI